jgi:hypothetical protein
VERSRLSVYFLYFAWRLWKSVVTLAVTGNTICGQVFRRQRVPVFQKHRLPLTGSRWDIRWLISRGTKPTFCVFPVFSVAVMESVVTLAVTGNTISGRVSWRQRVTVFQWHRLPLTGSRWDIRWLSSRGTKPTFCVFPVFRVAVMEKCCDACGDGEYYFRSGFRRQRCRCFRRHRLPLTGSRWDIRWLIAVVERSRLSVYFLYLAWRLWKSVVTLAVTGNTISGRFSASEGVGVTEASIVVDRNVHGLYGG